MALHRVGTATVGSVVGAAVLLGIGVAVWVRGIIAGVSGALGGSVILLLGVNSAEVVGDGHCALCVG